MTQPVEREERWPALPYQAWRDTCQTLHLWTQIVGKVRMELSPLYIKLRTSPLDTGLEQEYTCSMKRLNASGKVYQLHTARPIEKARTSPTVFLSRTGHERVAL